MVNVHPIITLLTSTPLALGGLGDISQYVLEAIGAFMERIINGATNLMIDVFNGLIWLIIGTPTPAQGEFNEQIFSIPQGGSWAPFYDFFIESVQPLAILLLILQVSLVLLFTSGPFLFSDYDKEKYFRRIFQSFVGVIAWWFMFSASTAFVNQLAMFLGGLNSGANVQSVGLAQFIEIVAQALLATAAIAAIGALAMLASTVLILFVIVMYVARMVVIYGYSFSMPLFMALWPANIGFLKPVSDLMKKLMGLYIPILFLTLPNAIMIRATYLFAEAAVTPSETSIEQDGVFGFLGTAIGDLLEGILFLAIALILPIIAVIAPKYVFQATSGSFGKVARSIERSRAMSQMSRGGMGSGMGGGSGGEASGGMGGSPSPSGSGMGGGTTTSPSDGMDSQPAPGGRSGTFGGTQSDMSQNGARGDAQRDYEFSIGRARFSTENARGRAQRLSQGMGAAQQKVGNVKSKFQNEEPTSTFQSIESRKKSYEDENGNRVPVETTEPTTLEDMDDEYVQPQTAYDRYDNEQLQEFESVADTGDGYESPEPYWTPEDAETAEGGMDVDPQTEQDWVNTDPEEYVGDTTFAVDQAQENGPIDRESAESPYGGGATTDVGTESTGERRGSDIGYEGEDIDDPFAELGDSGDDIDDPFAEIDGSSPVSADESNAGREPSEGKSDLFAGLGDDDGGESEGGGESRSGSDIDDLLSEEFNGTDSDGIDYERRSE